MTTLYDSPFSKYLNILKIFGVWVYTDRSNSLKMNLFVLYKIVMTWASLAASCMLIVDLYTAIGDFKKVTWNLCVTALFVGELFKNHIVYCYSNIVERMRIHLHEDMESRKQTEYEEIDRFAVRTLHIFEITFFALGFVFVPVLFVVWYWTHYWSTREWPLPSRFPIEFDLSNDRTYNIGYFFCCLGIVSGVVWGLLSELAMFSLLVQIWREYKVFLKQMQKVNDLYPDEEVSNQKEVNPFLLQMKTKRTLKELCVRQQKIFEYATTFEYVYNKPLLIHVFGVSTLLLVSVIQCMLDTEGATANTSYQMGYLAVLLIDLYLVCWFGSKLSSCCRDVGLQAYSIKWYLMNKEARIYINMMILRSQNPPKITSGKIMEMDVHTFVILIRNLYSWLTLFEQLAFKNDE